MRSPRLGPPRAAAPCPRRFSVLTRPLALALAVGCLFYLLQAVTLPSAPLAPSCAPSPTTDRLLHLLAIECARRQPTYISTTPEGTIHTSPDATGCRPFEIILAPNERGFGMCTDAAFYVLHLGARIVPFSPETFPQYNNTCQYPRTRARFHLETIYQDALHGAPRVKNVMLVNSEHLFTFDQHKHVDIDLYVCKTRFCVEPMRAYIKERNFKAEVMFVGHSSLDPTVPIPKLPSATAPASSTPGRTKSGSSSAAGGGGRRRLMQGAESRKPGPGGVVKDYQKVLHVRGKSGLKHTQQILECWSQHPDFPEITVVAFDYKLGQLVEFADTLNIKFLPPIPTNDTLRAQVRAARRELDRVIAEPWELDRAEFARAYREKKRQGASASTPPSTQAATPADPTSQAPSSTPATPAASAAVNPKQGPGPPSSRLLRQLQSKLLPRLFGGNGSHLQYSLSDVLRTAAPEYPEEEYRAAAAAKRKQHDEDVANASKEVDRVINAGPSVHGSITAEHMQRLQLESGIHVCVSEREGFGHYLNEARAAGALIVTTDHPPMNELVTSAMGVLVTPAWTSSYPEIQSLGKYTKINAFLPPDVICNAMDEALSLSVAEMQAMGRRAREGFLQGRCEFERRLQRLRALLMDGQ